MSDSYFDVSFYTQSLICSSDNSYKMPSAADAIPYCTSKSPTLPCKQPIIPNILPLPAIAKSPQTAPTPHLHSPQTTLHSNMPPTLLSTHSLASNTPRSVETNKHSPMPNPNPLRRFAHHFHLSQHWLIIPVFQSCPQPSR
jgi:hypothetical protein